MPKPRKKIKLTWAELRQQRSALKRFTLYLPTLKLRQQQLQAGLLKIQGEHDRLQQAGVKAQTQLTAYAAVTNDTAGLNLAELARPEAVHTDTTRLAGILLPRFVEALFPDNDYSLFATAAWTDQTLADRRVLARLRAEQAVVARQVSILTAELRKVTQRVNLFEKIIIPETRSNIRRIRIAMGDQMTAAVARAKIAKAKIEAKAHATHPGPAVAMEYSAP